jgi:non-ribosomal peptide synthase protein (TIGR01720 family)
MERLFASTSVYRAGIDDLLLTALGLALYGWRRDYYDLEDGPLLVDLEGHGREVGESGLDLSRTVGWFTSVYPVRVDFDGIDLDVAFEGEAAAGYALRLMKEELRRTSDRGLGYGVLRWLNAETREELSGLPQAEIAFNYLGRFELSRQQEGQLDRRDARWRLLQSGLVGGEDDPKRQRFHLLDVNALLDGSGCLRINWTYHPDAHQDASIQDLAERYSRALTALARHCQEAPLGSSYYPILPLKFYGRSAPLFCIHPLGGIAGIFNDLSRSMKNDSPVYGIQARGLEIGESPFLTFAEMIDVYIHSILERVPNGIIHLIGHSGGALIAHEIACILEKMGRRIGFVGLIDQPPHIAVQDSQFKTKDEHISEIAKELELVISDNHDSSEISKIFLDFFVNRQIVQPTTPITWVGRFLNEMSLGRRRLESHRVNKGNFDAVFFAGDAVTPTLEIIEERLKWKNYCKSVTYIPIQATHMRMLDPEPSKVIAAAIDALLDD